MGKRGVKPQAKVRIRWSPDFAYAVGLLASDGCLSSSGRHIVLTSTDKDQLENYQKALGIRMHIGRVKNKSSGAMRVQLGDVLFYRFLMNIGLMPNKSLVIGKIDVPDAYFFDFLRGSFDGDGSTYSYWDKRWKSSFMFYTTFVSASKAHVDWLQKTIQKRLGVRGHMTHGSPNRVLHQLKYAKADSLLLLRRMYRRKDCICLLRKRLKIERMLAIVGEQL
jgi:hypothetical protein